GRGSFIESFPLFGYSLEDYDELFSEKLELLIKVNHHEMVDWKGGMRPEILHKGVYPRADRKLPIWVAIGGTPASVVRAAQMKLNMALAIIGGEPSRFVPFVKYYREVLQASGHDVSQSKIGINSMGFIAEESQDAADIFYPSYAAAMTKIGKERGWGPTTREQFEWLRMPKGCLLVGSPQQVIDKLLYQHELFGNDRFMMQMCVGVLPHDKMMKSIELYGTKVLPVIKKQLSIF
ncbi:MAG: LLM class flavin-dependent oxidoreductase, partial [Chitinophagaceae bacterium]